MIMRKSKNRKINRLHTSDLLGAKRKEETELATIFLSQVHLLLVRLFSKTHTSVASPGNKRSKHNYIHIYICLQYTYIYI